jgi:NitT/TauT family transport system substrate-binding protein
MIMKRLVATIVAALTFSSMVRAEVSEVRFAEGFGLAYLPITVMVEDKLVEKRAQENGVGPVRTVLRRLSGGPAMIDALLSGQVDFISGGVPPMINLWDKTRGSLDVRAIASLGNTPLLLNTVHPEVTSLQSLIGRDKIAVPAVRISVQALTLQMAAEKLLGPGKHEALDDQTVSIPHPEATQMLLSGKTEVKTHFASMPFIWVQAKNPNIRTILSSYEVVGGPHSGSVLYNTGKWKAENPRVFRSVAQAVEDAMELIRSNPRRAAEIYVQANRSKETVGEIEEMLVRKDLLDFTSTPHNIMPYVTFMHRHGRIKNLPASWKELFWENMHEKQGS